MRRYCELLLVALVALTSGCEWLNNLRKPKSVAPGEKFEPKPARGFVEYLNRQSGYIQTIRYDSVSLKADLPDTRWVPRLNSGLLVCGKDRKLRLQAGMIVGGDQIDIGSNPQEMWMYVKQPEPTFLVCSHTDFARVQSDLPVPFEPDWLLQVLGVASYPDRPDYQSELNAKDRVYQLGFTERGANGQPLKKVIEFAGDRVDSTSPQVRRHIVYAETGPSRKWEVQTIAEVKQVQTVAAGVDPESGRPAMVQVPTHVVLEWPKQKVKMELRLGEVKVNDGRTNASLFTRPPSIGNVQPINLAEYRQQTPRGAAPRVDLPPPLPLDRR